MGLKRKEVIGPGQGVVRLKISKFIITARFAVFYSVEDVLIFIQQF